MAHSLRRIRKKPSRFRHLTHTEISDASKPAAPSDGTMKIKVAKAPPKKKKKKIFSKGGDE